MAIWAIADLHFSFGVPGKKMDIFGEKWKEHHEKIKASWDAVVSQDDLVLLAGDLSWAMHLEDAQKDFAWIDERPGTKVIIKGNHDYWWDSISKVRKALPPSIHAIQNDVFLFKDVAVGGARLWDTDEYNFAPYIEVVGELGPQKKDPKDAQIYERELMRLQTSLQLIPKDARIKIAMTHYPPISADLQDSRASKLFEAAHIQHVVFGHLHSLRANSTMFGEKNHIRYHLTSCDFLNFELLRIL
jgi:predicted phosphohydrolase